MKTAFCPNCGCMVEYETLTVLRAQRVRNVDFVYNESSAFCMDCGRLLYSPEINDLNVQRQLDAYHDASKGEEYASE